MELQTLVTDSDDWPSSVNRFSESVPMCLRTLDISTTWSNIYITFQFSKKTSQPEIGREIDFILAVLIAHSLPSIASPARFMNSNKDVEEVNRQVQKFNNIDNHGVSLHLHI